ncbi:MAG: hypothetical protein ACRDOU_05040 [Streptosporangiaceae bacterium]
MRRSITRAAAGAAVAAATVLALAGPANAAPHGPVHTTLSIVESKTVIHAGHEDVVSGRLVALGVGVPGRVVFLDRVYGKTLVEKQVRTTGPAGGVAFTVTPGVTARYELVYKGNAVLAPTHSGIVTVKVISAPPPLVHTTLSIAASKSIVRYGHKDVVSGRLAAYGIGLAGRTVYLDRVSGKTLIVLQVRTTGLFGGVAFTLFPKATARYELVYKGNAVYAPAHSGIVTIKVYVVV